MTELRTAEILDLKAETHEKSESPIAKYASGKLENSKDATCIL